MKECKPVSVPNGSFIFCRYSVAVLLWTALIFKLEWMIWITFAILALSAILKVKNAPMVFFYTHTFNRIFPSKNVVLDENGMRFAHTMGAVLNFICIILLYCVNDIAGWVAVFVVAVAKTFGAFGYCSGLKLYNCMNSGTCCRITRKKQC